MRLKVGFQKGNSPSWKRTKEVYASVSTSMKGSTESKTTKKKNLFSFSVGRNVLGECILGVKHT